jgi:hypothetical protein
LGLSVEAQVDEGLGSITPGEPAPYAAIGYVRKNRRSAKSVEHAWRKIIGDIPNFTNVQPTIQIGYIILPS